jgi:hypothetical protein
MNEMRKRTSAPLIGAGVVFYTYGPDADRLIAGVERCASDFPVPAGSYAVKRYAPPDEAASSSSRSRSGFDQT